MTAEPGVLVLDRAGAIRGASARARQLLHGVSEEEFAASLRALHARSAMAGDDRPVLGELRRADGGRILMTAAWANRELTVIVQADPQGRRANMPPGPLTARESEIVDLVAQGLPTKRIAALLGISPWTVTTHLRTIFGKTGVTSRAELLALMLVRARQAA